MSDDSEADPDPFDLVKKDLRRRVLHRGVLVSKEGSDERRSRVPVLEWTAHLCPRAAVLLRRVSD
jgi:hypothetical protein